MFKNWKERETTQTAVSDDDRKEIADLLGHPADRYSRGQAIPMHVSSSENLKLKINDFGKGKALNSAIRQYYDLLID